MKKIFVLASVGLFLAAGCAKHDSANRSYRRQGNEFIGVKPTDPLGQMQDAIGSDELDKVRELLAAGLDINAILPNQRTPLIHATRESKYRIMSELLKHNPDREIKDTDGKTALDHALQNAGVDGEGKQLINRAVILLSEEAQLSQRKELLKFAGRGSAEPIGRLLKDVGVNPNFVDDTGETPLTLAIRKQKRYGVAALAEWRDCPNGEGKSDCLRLTAIDLDLAGTDGVKPLALAKQFGNLEIVEILTRLGAKE